MVRGRPIQGRLFFRYSAMRGVHAVYTNSAPRYTRAAMDDKDPRATDWREVKRHEVFESTLRGLERRRAVDPAFAKSDAEGTLRHLYIQEGNDWVGRGELQDIILEASIAAYEHFIAEWDRVPVRSARPGQE